MNDNTLTQLKILVERAVRPVRASSPRKRKMREELLAHVMAVFEEELARHNDESAALDRTALRFGHPSEVTSQLQESVPARDRMDRLLESAMVRIFPPGESSVRRALRLAAFLALLWLAVLATAGIEAWTTTFWLFGISLALSGFFTMFELYLLADWMRNSLFSGQRSRRKALLGAASAVVLFPAGLVPHALFGPTPVTLKMVLLMSVAGPVLVTCVCFMGRRAADNLTEQAEWARLDLTREKGAAI